MIDREKRVKAFFNGYGSVINSFVPSTEWIAADPKDLKITNMILKNLKKS